jgi:hypothetical protein
MVTTSLNSKLHKAKSSKKDEFYTQLSDIERELRHYKKHFEGKIVYCNCDDPMYGLYQYLDYSINIIGVTLAK